MERKSHLSDATVPLGTNVNYECILNHYFADQDVPVEKSLNLTCPDDGMIVAPSWPECIAGETSFNSVLCCTSIITLLAMSFSSSSSCLPLWSFIAKLSKHHTRLADWRHDKLSRRLPVKSLNRNSPEDLFYYLHLYSYSCVDERFNIKVPSWGNSSMKQIGTRCMWSKKWTLEPFLAELECELIRCRPPPIKSSRKLISSHVVGEDVIVNDQIEFRCFNSPSEHFFESDRGSISLTLTCLRTGEYDEPSQWPNCVPGTSSLWAHFEGF